VHYADLWAALKILYTLESNHHKTLPELCTDNFRGTFEHKFAKPPKNILSRLFHRKAANS
jgi:hypothetical protein